MDGEAPSVVTAACDGIGEIVLNRPAARNALNLAMCVDLQEAVRRMESDDTVRVVILRGSGTAFCAGADLKERRVMTPEQVRARRLAAFAAYQAIEELSKPIVAMVHGAVVGSGGEIAAACDFIIASDTASFRYPEAVGGTIGATQRLPRIVGLARAKELLFTGRELTAAEALAWGLVNRVVPAADLDAAVRALAAQMAAAPSETMRLTKRCLVRPGSDARRRALADELDAIDEWLAGGGASPGLPALERPLKKTP